jgi:hypothetical protein
MDDEYIARVRDRINRARRVVQMARDPEMIALLEEMIGEAEADLQKLEAEQIPRPTAT